MISYLELIKCLYDQNKFDGLVTEEKINLCQHFPTVTEGILTPIQSEMNKITFTYDNCEFIFNPWIHSYNLNSKITNRIDFGNLNNILFDENFEHIIFDGEYISIKDLEEIDQTELILRFPILRKRMILQGINQ